MNDDLASYLARLALRICRDLQDANALIKDHAAPSEQRSLALGIAATIQTVMTNLVDEPLATRPALRAKIEGQIDLYGRYL